MFGSYDALGGSPYGSASQEQLQELLKAIQAGHETAAGGSNETGFALRPESLEATLKNLTFRDEHVQLWKQLPKSRAFNTIEEFNQLSSYGTESFSAFTQEGELPAADDSTYLRKLTKIKFMGTLRAVSHPMGMVTSAHGSVIDQETVNGTLWLMRQVEKALIFGDETTNSAAWDGMVKQIAVPPSNKTMYEDPSACTGNILDLKSASTGKATALTEDSLDTVCEDVYGSGNFGKLTDVYYSTAAHRQFARDVLGSSSGNIRVNVDNLQGGPLKAGYTMSAFASQFGDVNLKPNVFMTPRKVTQATIAAHGNDDSSKGTVKPAAPSFTITHSNEAGVVWNATGFYTYTVVAVNSGGSSAGATIKSDDTEDVSTKLALTITPGAGGTPDGYIIFRSKVNALAGGDANTELFEIGRVKDSGGATTSYVDKDQIVAGSSMALAFTMNTDVCAFKQLAPFTKIPLAQIDLRTRWAQVLYGAPVLYAPQKCALIINILDS
jgi:hypothetical protein